MPRPTLQLVPPSPRHTEHATARCVFFVAPSALAALAAALLLLALLPGCGGAVTPPLEAPAWDRVALGVDDPDLVGAINLRQLRADPVFGPLVERLARQDDMGVLMRGSQIDMVATVRSGELRTWVAVVHGVDGPPGEHDVGSWLGAPHTLPSGATEYPGGHDGSLIAVPGAWILGKGAPFDRVRDSATTAPAAIALPDRALVASTVVGRAIPRSRDEDFASATDGLQRATFELLGGSGLDFVLRCDFVDSDAARRATRLARAEIAAFAARTDAVSTLVRALVKIDFSVSGSVVTSRLTIDDALRELLAHFAEIEARG
jgi:hypothetical protein